MSQYDKIVFNVLYDKYGLAPELDESPELIGIPYDVKCNNLKDAIHNAIDQELVGPRAQEDLVMSINMIGGAVQELDLNHHDSVDHSWLL